MVKKSKKKKSQDLGTFGSWAFILGILIAIIAGFFPLGVTVTSILIILGLIVGFLNITAKQSKDFLLTIVGLVILLQFGGFVLGGVAVIGLTMQNMLNAVIIFTVPAAVVVALKLIFGLASER